MPIHIGLVVFTTFLERRREEHFDNRQIAFFISNLQDLGVMFAGWGVENGVSVQGYGVRHSLHHPAGVYMSEMVAKYWRTVSKGQTHAIAFALQLESSALPASRPRLVTFDFPNLSISIGWTVSGQNTLHVLHNSLTTDSGHGDWGSPTSSLSCFVSQCHCRAGSSDSRWRTIPPCRVYASLRGSCVRHKPLKGPVGSLSQYLRGDE